MLPHSQRIKKTGRDNRVFEEMNHVSPKDERQKLHTACDTIFKTR